MGARPEYRDRPDVEVDVLDVLVTHADDGMTVLDVRAHVDADIDQLEDALASLKDDDLIRTERAGERVVIRPAPQVIPDRHEETDDDPPPESFVDWVRQKLGF